MSEVKRISVFIHGPNKKIDMVEAAQLDRVTAERDALQHRLTAADERMDALASLVPEAELALKALNVAVSVYDVELADGARRGLRLIIAALNPTAEGCVHEFIPFTEGCSKCGEPYTAEGASHEA